jgi:hypothetical protein
MSNPFDNAYSEYKKGVYKKGSTTVSDPKFSSKTKTSFKKGSTVKSTIKGVNQVAIKGGSEEIIISDSTSKQTTDTSETISSDNPYIVARYGQPVSVSGKVVGSATQQSIREDRPYVAYVEKKEYVKSTKPIISTTNTTSVSNTYTQADNKNKTLSEKAASQADRYEYKAMFESNPVKKQEYSFYAAGLGVASVLAAPLNPIKFFNDTVSSTKELLTNPRGVAVSFGSQLRDRPAFTTGQISGNILLGKTPGFAKNTYIRAGSKYVAPETVFDTGSLTGQTTFPLTDSIKQSLREFNTKTNGETIVVTASPAKLKGNLAGAGERAISGTEDPGIYVTPKGKGSPRFTGIELGNEVSTYSFSINPFKDAFSVPSVTEFKVGSVVQYPRNVINKGSGFKTVWKYQVDVLSNKGVAVITKRSEIGQGNIPGKGFKGTSELEAVVPIGSGFEYTPKTFVGGVKGFDTYTVIGGKPVAVRSAKVLGEGQSIGRGSQALKSSTVSSGSESLSRLNDKKITFSPTATNIVQKSKAYTSDRDYQTTTTSSYNYVYNSKASSLSYVSPSRQSIQTSNSSNNYKDYSESFGSRTSSRLNSRSQAVSSSSNLKNVSSYRPESPVSRSNIYSSRIVRPSRSTYKTSSNYYPSKTSYRYTPTSRIITPTKPVIDGFIGENKDDVFSVEVRRRGEFKTVGRFKDLGLAFGAGKFKIKSGLGATFRVRSQSGTIIKPGGVGGEFYIKPGGEVIQKRGYRLGSRGEVTEIGYEKSRSRRSVF